MLKKLVLEKIGFGESLKLNDVVIHEEEEWIIRAISKSAIKSRYVKFGRYSGFQNDVIVACVVAQKVRTFNFSNFKQKRISLESTTEIQKGNWVSVGDIVDYKDAFYIIDCINELKFSFIDLKTSYEAISVTELKDSETVKLSQQKKLNDKGWKVIS